jgi:PIN domain nuclease of toxin-antitoxin system
MIEAILLDTHAAIWFSEGTLPAESLAKVVAATIEGQAFVSPATAWEAGLLAKRNRYQFESDPFAWFRWLIDQARLIETPLTSQILIDSSLFPGNFHNDPADRMLIATARALDCTLLTRDAAILAYAAQGHVKAMAC